MARELETNARKGGQYTQEQSTDYDDYLAALKLYPNLPTVKDITDFLARRDEIAANWDDYLRGYTEEQLREFNTWKRYASAYGGLTDWYPTSIEDWLANYDKAQAQLAKWQRADESAQRAYEAAQPSRKELTAEERLFLSPGEQLRRQQEAYQEARYAAQERYRETPMLSETFASWMDRQKQMSGAFTGFVEDKYSSLRGIFEAGQPREVGYPTREAARAAAGRTESLWQAWLPQQVPGLYQEYMGQPAWMRGERIPEKAPTLRAANW